jgi:hypothetical protein
MLLGACCSTLDQDRTPLADTYVVKVSASAPGGSSGGLFVAVDVAVPAGMPPEGDRVVTSVWLGTGPAMTLAVDERPGAYPHVSAAQAYTLNDGRWRGSVALTRGKAHSKLWVYVELCAGHEPTCPNHTAGCPKGAKDCPNNVAPEPATLHRFSGIIDISSLKLPVSNWPLKRV